MTDKNNTTNKTNTTQSDINVMETIEDATKKAQGAEPYWLNTTLLKYIIISDSRNTKEEYETLNGLFMGNYMFEERKGLKDVKLSKIIDLL